MIKRILSAFKSKSTLPAIALLASADLPSAPSKPSVRVGATYPIMFSTGYRARVTVNKIATYGDKITIHGAVRSDRWSGAISHSWEDLEYFIERIREAVETVDVSSIDIPTSFAKKMGNLQVNWFFHEWPVRPPARSSEWVAGGQDRSAAGESPQSGSTE